MLRRLGWLAVSATLITTTAAHAACMLQQIGTLITEPDMRMIVTQVTINGQPTHMLVDSGSFATTLWRDRAASLKVRLGNVVGADIYGVGGRTAVQIAYLDSLGLGNSTVHNMRVYVIDSKSITTQAAGLFGADLLSQADVDFDLVDNRINLLRDKDCTGPQLVYWNKPYSQAQMQGGDAAQTNFFVTVLLNGRPVEAMIDSGASTTVIDGSLAANLGASPLVAPTAGEEGRGIGYKALPVGVVRFDTFTLGDETIKNAKIRTANLFSAIHIDETGSRLGSHANAEQFPRMLLGADFLHSHRMLISPRHQMIYFSYLGGPVFDVENVPNRGIPTAPPRNAGATSEPK